MSLLLPVSLVLALAVIPLFPAVAAAQPGVSVSGRIVNTLSGEPVGGATIRIDELARETVSSADGGFSFADVPPGAYHLSMQSPGYSPRRLEVVVSTMAVDVGEWRVEPELHFEEVVSVSAGPPRSQFEALQPTSVLAGQELAKRVEMSLGATLEHEPGVAARSFGPAPARPVVRGLDGDRVLILQDGQRLGDLSSQSGDHGVAINPAAARRIEVVRGPATLLYGANAIGGLVNVLTEDVPTTPIEGASGTARLDLGSAADEAAGSADVRVGNGHAALHVGGGARRSGDVATPEGEVSNTQSRQGFGTVGLSWTGERAYLGGSYGYDDTKYGVPVVEEGALSLAPRRHAWSVRAGARDLQGPFSALRATVSARRYRHDEIEGGEVGTTFSNRTTEAELMASHRRAGRLAGSFGGWFFDRAFATAGKEALSPPVDQRSVAVFGFEEIAWPHVTLQAGARIERTRYEPVGEPARTFTNPSGSVGLLLRPAAADDRLTIAASAARASRAPALEELFFFGPHHGNFAIELGNPFLESERALGLDVSARWRGSRASGEVTWFRNDVRNFIFRRLLDEEEFEAREEELLARFPGRALPGGEGSHAHDELAVVDFIGADAVLQGVEAHGDVAITQFLFAEAGLDAVRGSLADSDEPLPRMPPLRVRWGLRYQAGAFQAGGEVVHVARQDRVSGAETPTDGYTRPSLYAVYSFPTGGAVSTVTARVDNATDTLYRNHLSLIKDVVPEMGRSFKLLYEVTF